MTEFMKRWIKERTKKKSPYAKKMASEYNKQGRDNSNTFAKKTRRKQTQLHNLDLLEDDDDFYHPELELVGDEDPNTYLMNNVNPDKNIGFLGNSTEVNTAFSYTPSESYESDQDDY